LPENSLFQNISIKEFKVEGQKFKYKPLTWFEDETIIFKCSEIDTKKKKYILNVPEMYLSYMLESLKEAPFEINRDNLLKLTKKAKDEIIKNIKPRKLDIETKKK